MTYDEYAKLWEDIFKREKFLAWQAPKAAKEFSKITGLEFLGSGYGRGVFALSEDEVLKLAIDSQGYEDNLTECSIWKKTPRHLREAWLAPVLDCSKNGSWLVMQRADRLSIEEWNAIENSPEIDEVLMTIGVSDYEGRDQWGVIDHPVLIDYGAKLDDGERIENPSLPPKAARMWEHVYEAAQKRGLDKSAAAASAWCAVKRHYHKKGGRWLKRKKSVEQPPGCTPFRNPKEDNMKTNPVASGPGRIRIGGPFVDRAIKDMQLYLGSVDYASVKQQQKFYTKVQTSVGKFASKYNMDLTDAWDQIETEARRRGIKRPIPGHHMNPNLLRSKLLR